MAGAADVVPFMLLLLLAAGAPCPRTRVHRARLPAAAGGLASSPSGSCGANTCICSCTNATGRCTRLITNIHYAVALSVTPTVPPRGRRLRLTRTVSSVEACHAYAAVKMDCLSVMPRRRTVDAVGVEPDDDYAVC